MLIKNLLRSLLHTIVEKPIVTQEEKRLKGIYCPHCNLKIYRIDLENRCVYCGNVAIAWNPAVNSYIIERRYCESSSEYNNVR